MNKKSTSNYVDLVKLKAEKLFQNKNLGIFLNDDIWENSTLLVKGGRYLTEDLINKLLNFGVKQVDVDFIEKNDGNRKIINDFINNQNVLIIENNLLEASWLVRNLVDIGFKEGNIFVTADYNSINRYFRIKKINFIFTGFSLYEKCLKCVNKYSMLKNTHAFVTMEKKDSLRKIERDYNSDVKFLRKPLNAKLFKRSIINALNHNLLDSYVEEERIS